jgi:hypothetical protein
VPLAKPDNVVVEELPVVVLPPGYCVKVQDPEGIVFKVTLPVAVEQVG